MCCERGQPSIVRANYCWAASTLGQTEGSSGITGAGCDPPNVGMDAIASAEDGSGAAASGRTLPSTRAMQEASVEQ